MDTTDKNEEHSQSVFIIKKSQNSLRQAETYLKHRNWNLRVAFDIKHALVAILKDPPKYIIISVEHPHPKVLLLPKIIAQVLKCVVIPYAESNSPLVLSKLNEVGSEFILFPPVSGPAIERVIKRVILKEKEPLSEKNKVFSSSGMGVDSKDSHTFIAKGGNTVEEDDIAIKGAREALAKMFSDEDDTLPGVLGHLESSGIQNHKTDLMIQKGLDGRTNAHLDAGSKSEVMSSSQSSAKKGQDHHSHKDNTAEPNHYNGQESTSSSAEHRNSLNKKNNSRDFSIDQPDSINGQSYDTKTRKQLPKLTMGELSISVDTAISSIKEEENSILIQSSKQAIEKTVKFDQEKQEEAHPIGVATNVSCIIVQSVRFNGYLVVAMGKNQRIEESFMKMLKKHLFKFLKDNGEKLSDEEQMQLKLEPVEFQDWAIEHADFLRKSIHNGNEVAMAFFPSTEIQIPLEPGKDKDMYTVDLINLRGDLKMEFDIYIHMPINNKYILFTPKGGVLYSHQKDRLLKKGIQKMHLHKNSIKDVKKYTAQNYLNDKINEFQKKGTKKNAS